MYQKFIALSDDAYIEVTSRLFDQKESIVLAVRGTKDESSPALASVIIEPSQAESLIICLQEALQKVNSQE